MKRLLSLFLLVSIFYSCVGSNKSQDSTVVTHLLKIRRFDIDFHNYLKDNSTNNLRILQDNYDKFLPAFGRVTINNSDSFKPEFYQRLCTYFSNDMLMSIYADELNTFSDITALEVELSESDRLIGQYFNGKQLPILSMHVSGFKENVMVLQDMISISSDKYLGANYPLYKQFFEGYQLIQMEPKMIACDYLKAWIISDNEIDSSKKDLLSSIIYEGKILYTLSELLPSREDSDIIAFTKEQIAWCEANESKMWKSLVEQNNLYSTDYQLINKYVDDAPYTAPFSIESPGRSGAWLGWQIVKSYMSNKDVSLSELYKKGAQEILKDSKYNP